MEKKRQKDLFLAVSLLAAFVVWTVLVRFVDVHPMGPLGSTVGFAALNRAVHGFTGVHMWLYTVTDWMGLVPIFTALGFAILGLLQWIKRKRLSAVDRDILFLGGFYLAVMTAFFFFEFVIVNYRPTLIDGCLEASYPSSTTLLVLTVMPTAMMQFSRRIVHRGIRYMVLSGISLFIAFMVIGRLFSGVHWVTDIVGGALLSGGLVMLYRFFAGKS